jgi:hypothetical protein
VCECSFWGVRNSPCGDEQGCRDIWTKAQRDMVAFYLAEAQEEIERELRYFLCPRWVTDERHPYTTPVKTTWGYVIAGGVRGESVIEDDAAVDLAADPAIVGPYSTTVTDEDEIAVFHVDSDVEIPPSAVTISGGQVIIEIPRCRLVKPSLADNPTTGLNYTGLSNFVSTVDVHRVYNDTTTQAIFVRPACDNSCDETTGDACIYVRHSDVGSVNVPLSSLLCGCGAEFVELNYYAGIGMTRQARDTIIRLAHSKMPNEPCGCSPINEVWRRDRFVPTVLTTERLNCPFGLSDGAWIAWRWTQAQALKRGAIW